jgi:hypothetical protein
MACRLKVIADLPIREDYKIALLEFLQKPEHAQQCEQLTNAPPEKIMALLQNMEQSIGGQQAGGQAPPAAPPPPQAAPQTTPNISPPGGQGIASIPQAAPRSQIPPGMAPSQLSRTPRPMDMPRMPGRRY